MIKEAIARRIYGEDESQWYSDVVLMEMIEKEIHSQMRILDVGAGAGEGFRYNLRGRVREVVGVDADPRVKTNVQLDRAISCDIYNIPVEENHFDLAFCRYVLEHVADPAKFVVEMSRILKDGGRLIFLTPSKWHYFSIGARLTPHSFHEWYNRRLRGRASEDTFPTRYRMNSARDLRRHLGRAGFSEKALIRREIYPTYLDWSLPTFLMGVAYERLVSSVGFLAGFRIHLLGNFVCRKAMPETAQRKSA